MSTTNHDIPQGMLNSISCGDSAELLRKIPDCFVDLVVTSPPYDNLRDYNNGTKWTFDCFTEIARQFYRIIKQGGVVVWVVGDSVVKGGKTLTAFRQALFFQDLGFNMFDVIIYEKAGTAPPHKNRYFNAFEYMFVLSKGAPETINILADKPNKWANRQTFGSVSRREQDGSLTPKGRKTIKPYGVRTNIWRYNNGKGFATKDEIAYSHPAIFPEKLAADHIISWSNVGDVVLDPFCGSGTVPKIAKSLGRNYIGVEISPRYCEIARKRLASLTSQLILNL